MSNDWVVTALVGLGNDPKEAEGIAVVFRAIRESREPDALTVFLGLIKEIAGQAEEKIAEANTQTDKLRGLLVKADAYTDHNWSCTNSYMTVGCTCGVETLRKEIDAENAATMAARQP